MKTLNITQIILSPTPSGNTPCTAEYERSDNTGTWILISNNVSVPPSGVLSSPLQVFGIPDNIDINVRAVANCGGTPYSEGSPTTTTTTAATTTTTTAATTTTTTTVATTTTTTAATTTTTTTSAPPSTVNVIIENVGSDIDILEMKIDGVTVPFVSGYPVHHDETENFEMTVPATADVLIRYSSITNLQNIVLRDTGGTALACLEVVGSHTNVSNTWNGVTLTPGHDLRLEINLGPCA